jgi:hypothetical protein
MGHQNGVPVPLTAAWAPRQPLDPRAAGARRSRVVWDTVAMATLARGRTGAERWALQAGPALHCGSKAAADCGERALC